MNNSKLLYYILTFIYILIHISIGTINNKVVKIDNNGNLYKDYTTDVYTDAIYIPITNEQGMAMHSEAIKIRDNPGWYNLYNHNCNQVAQIILSAGGKDFASSTFNWQGTIPNLVKTALKENIRPTLFSNILNVLDSTSHIGYNAIDWIDIKVGENDLTKYLKQILNVDILNNNNNYIGWMIGKIGDFQFKNGCISKR